MKGISNKVQGFIMRHSFFSIIFIDNMVYILTALMFYPLLPVLMGYPPNARNVSLAVGASYEGQFILILLPTMLIETMVLLIAFRDMKRLKVKFDGSSGEEALSYLKAIRRRCINLPYIVYVAQLLACALPLILVFVVAQLLLSSPFYLSCKLAMVIISVHSLAAVFSFTFSKGIFTRILYYEYVGEELEGRRIGFKTKIFLQVVPMIMVAIMITSLVGYSRLIKEKGDMLYIICKDALLHQVENIAAAENEDQVLQTLRNIKIQGINMEYFLVMPDKSIKSSAKFTSNIFYRYYIENPYNRDRVYGNTEEVQGVVSRVSNRIGTSIVGLKYEVASSKTAKIFFICFAALLGINVFILYYFSKGVANDIEVVAKSLNEIAEGKDVDLRRKLPVTSNDEIGDLAVSFNLIREREYRYDKLRNEFFANVSHELKTPISIIFSTVQFIEKYHMNIENPEKHMSIYRHMGTIRQNCYRMLRLVNNIIDSTKIDVNFFNVHMQNCNIVGIVNEIAESVANYVEQKGMKVSFASNVEKKLIACDPDIIERIMLNLLSNAVKFTNPGGEISVRLLAKGEYIDISVKDTGIGIPKDEQLAVFERFRQVENSFKKNKGGSGIGLSLVKSFAEMHGGSVSVVSEYGKGSEFTVRIPCKVIPKSEINYMESEKVSKGVESIAIEFSDV